MAAPSCPAHPDQPADGACARCGDFLCPLCGSGQSARLCPGCQVRTAVPWEAGEDSRFKSLGATWWEAVSRPARFAERLWPGESPWPALNYVALAGAAGALPWLLWPALRTDRAVWMGPARSPALVVLVLYPLLFWVAATTFAPVASGLWSLLLWGSARLLGVRVALDTVARAVAYGMSLAALPLVGLALMPAACVQQGVMVWSVLRRYGHGEGGRPSSGRAAVVVLLPWLMVAAAALVLYKV